MAQIDGLSQDELSFLLPYLPEHGTRGDEIQRPFVTLTYACSLDGMISISPGVRTSLSGPETKSMTHYLRLHHDAILVGAGTAVADDPGLNSRYPGASLNSQPRPIVVDPNMRWDIRGSKAGSLALEQQGKAPWMLHTPRELPAEVSTPSGSERLLVGKDGLENLVPSSALSSQPIDWSSILKALHQKGIRSVMIEGGATVINHLLSQPALVDSVIVTIAPTWLGQGGLTVSPDAKTTDGQRVNAATLKDAAWRQFGQDSVLCGRLK